MRIDIRSSFEKDTKKLSNTIKEDIAEALALLSEAKTLADIPQLKDMKGAKKGKKPLKCALAIIGFVFTLQMKL